MSKKIVTLLLILIFLLPLFIMCGGEEENTGKTDTGKTDTGKTDTGKTDTDKTDDKIVIGLALPTYQEERWVRDGERMQEEAAKHGVELLLQMAAQDAGKQASQVENLLSQGIDVLILAPVDSESAATLVDKAEDEGVPVISYDRLIMNTPNVDVYISFDNVGVGRLQGKFLTDRVPKGNYIILSGAPTDNNAKLFKQGAMEYIQPLIDSGDINVIIDQPCIEWRGENAMKHVENALTIADNDVQAILAPNDGTAGGAIQALAAQGLDGKVWVSGQDAEEAAAKRIVKGQQSMTVFKDTRLLGTAAVEAAIKLAKGEKLNEANSTVNNNIFDVPSILLTPYSIDKDNIDDLLIGSGYLTHEQVYGEGGEDTTVAEPKKDITKIKVGLALPTYQEERWVRDGERMQEEADKYGFELLLQMAAQDAGKQASQVENLLSQGIDVLILAPVDSESAATLVDKAEDEGVPVISYDRLIMNTPNVDVYISFDNVGVGRLQGKFLTDRVPKGNYIILSGAPTDNNAKLFKQGAMEYIQPLIDSGDINVIIDQPCIEWRGENAMKHVENALTIADNDVQAILAPNDGTAGGAIQALAAQGLDGKVWISGQDAEEAAAKRIVKGQQSMTVFKDTRLLGTAAIEAAIKLALGQELTEVNGAVNNNIFDVPSILLIPYAVDKDNIDDLLIGSGYLTHEQVYGE